MAKKKEDTPPPGSPAWMATFSDLMNLLLCFFVLLFSMSSIEEAKLNELVAAMNNSFSIFESGATAIGDGILIGSGVSQLNELDRYINSTGRTAENDSDSDKLELTDLKEEEIKQIEEMLEEQNLQSNEELAELISEAVKENNMTEQIDVTFNSKYVQLTMKGALLFDSGSADLKDAARQILDKTAIILERYAKDVVEIEGHTDNIPIKSGQYPSNEELSSARALSVFYYLIDNSSLDPTVLKHAGMGERIPIADNSTPEGRSKNRRVEIKIYNPS